MTLVICMLAVVILNAVLSLRLVLVYISFRFYSVSIFSVFLFFFLYYILHTNSEGLFSDLSTAFNAERCSRREPQEGRMILLNDHVAEEDLKLFRHIKEITAKVRRVYI